MTKIRLRDKEAKEMRRNRGCLYSNAHDQQDRKIL